MCLPCSCASTSYEQVQTTCLQCVGQFWTSVCKSAWGRSLLTDSVFKKHRCPCCARHDAKCFANIISKLTKISKSPGMLYNIWSFYIFTEERRPWPKGAQLVSLVETKRYASESIFWPHFDVLFACNMLSVSQPFETQEMCSFRVTPIFKTQVSYFFFSVKKEREGGKAVFRHPW